MENLWQDVRYGLRMLAKNSGFTAIAVVALALGIGANTAIFSVVNAMLLQALPFKDADSLMLAWRTKPDLGFPQLPFSYPDYSDLKAQGQTFEDMAAWSSFNDTKFNLTGGEQPEQVQYAIVSANLFSTLGVEPVLGRRFLDEEDEPGAQRVVILSHELWRRRFGSDPDVVGKPLAFDGNSYTVVGVMPAGFEFPRFAKSAEVWVPIASDPTSPDPKFGRRWVRTIRYLGVIARLKAGVTQEQAQAELATIAASLEKQYPNANTGWGMSLTPLHRQVVGNMRQALFVLLGAVGFVLLIACANVANLLLARATARRREMAIRMALGASRSRIIRQLLTESVMLALAGGAVGLLLALWAVDLLAAIPYNAPSIFIPYRVAESQIALDGRVLGFTLLISIATGVMFGLAPALRTSRPDLNESLKEGNALAQSGARRAGLRSLLVVAEIALSLVLLIGGGLMIRSFLRLQQVDPGFDPSNILTAEVNLPQSKYPEGRKVAAFYQQLVERIQSAPGVASVGAVSALPLSGAENGAAFFIEGQPPLPPGEKNQGWRRTVTEDYFRAMGIGVVKGRAFTGGDSESSPRVIIINETFARRYFPDADPVGKRIAPDFEAMKFDVTTRRMNVDIPSAMREIVGVVRDVRHVALDVDPKPEMYLPYLQSPERDMSLVVRATSDPETLAGFVRREVLALDKDQPVAGVTTMRRLLSDTMAKPRFNFILLGVFALVALMLAAVGVYGVVSYSVTQRTREIGIRMALGATSRAVLGMVVREGLALAVAGLAVGIGLALALTRMLSSLLYEVSATDPLTFAVISLVLGAVAMAACYIPARRATRVDPMIALRYE